jgi:hypothetical protein
MKSLIQVIISSLILCVATSSFADETENKEKQRIKTQNMKFLVIKPLKSLAMIEEGIDKINQNCCEDNFDKKNEFMKIKNILEKCLSDKCHENTMPIYFKKIPPFKAIAMRELTQIDNLILENEELKFKNISLMAKKSEELLLKNSLSQTNIKELKQNIKKMSDDNDKLRKKIDIMIVKYMKKIEELKKDNKILNDKFDIVYEMHSSSKKKKLDKLLSE